MRCANELCVYQRQNKCTLSHIHIDALGQCEDCIHVHLSAEMLAACKQAQRRALTLRDENAVEEDAQRHPHPLR